MCIDNLFTMYCEYLYESSVLAKTEMKPLKTNADRDRDALRVLHARIRRAEDRIQVNQRDGEDLAKHGDTF